MYYGEKLNSISHLVGAVFALVALGSLLTISLQTGEPVVIFGFSVFGLSLVLLYSMSTLYHSFYEPKLKSIFKIWDHIAIYLLIAGTYTPIMLISLQENNGWFILGVVWSLAAIGIISELTLTGRTIKVFQIINNTISRFMLKILKRFIRKENKRIRQLDIDKMQELVKYNFKLAIPGKNSAFINDEKKEENSVEMVVLNPELKPRRERLQTI